VNYGDAFKALFACELFAVRFLSLSLHNIKNFRRLIKNGNSKITFHYKKFWCIKKLKSFSTAKILAYLAGKYLVIGNPQTWKKFFFSFSTFSLSLSPPDMIHHPEESDINLPFCCLSFAHIVSYLSRVFFSLSGLEGKIADLGMDDRVIEE
jgi:hypothetical protein